MPINWGALKPTVYRANVPDARGLASIFEHTVQLASPQAEQGSNSVTIRLADCDGQRNGANMLLSRMYSWRGYGRNHQIPSAPDCVTFTASSENDVVGTLTLSVDGQSRLAADRTFPDEIRKFRDAPGAKLCELTKFAFDSSGPSRPRLAALFHIMFIYGSTHFKCTDLFIEVNPRHRRYYQVMLGFTPVGEVKTNDTVGAPSQLMWLNVGEIRRLIDRFASDEPSCERSLYPHFFSAKEEEGIYARMTAPKSAAPRGLGRRFLASPRSFLDRNTPSSMNDRSSNGMLRTELRGRGFLRP